MAWLVETKGEIRSNTALKSEAATQWCDKMSRTAYRHWRYLVVPQRKFEGAVGAGVKSLADLAASLVMPRPEPQLRLIPLDDARVKRKAFKTLLPLYSLKAAAGYFGSGETVEPEAWVEAGGIGKLDAQMFVARAGGRSMESTIHDGDLLVFRANPTGTRQGKIVLAQYRGVADPETGGCFTVKRHASEKSKAERGQWKHTRIVLSPLKKDFAPIAIPTDAAKPVGSDDRSVVKPMNTPLASAGGDSALVLLGASANAIGHSNDRPAGGSQDRALLVVSDRMRTFPLIGLIGYSILLCHRDELPPVMVGLGVIAGFLQLFDGRVYLADRLARLVGQHERLVIDLGNRLLGDHPQERRRRHSPELRIDGTENRVLAHHDLVGRERDQRPSRHRIMRDEHRDFRGVLMDRPRDLQRGEHQAARRVEDQIDRRSSCRCIAPSM
jgi:SOS-response transcriptional repressor LexA